jgi:hypothetical protein
MVDRKAAELGQHLRNFTGEKVSGLRMEIGNLERQKIDWEKRLTALVHNDLNGIAFEVEITGHGEQVRRPVTLKTQRPLEDVIRDARMEFRKVNPRVRGNLTYRVRAHLLPGEDPCELPEEVWFHFTKRALPRA